MCRARVAAMKSVVDQERLRQRMTDWQADGNVKLFFRPYVDVSESDDGSDQTTTDDDLDVPVQVCDRQTAFYCVEICSCTCAFSAQRFRPICRLYSLQRGALSNTYAAKWQYISNA